MRVRAVIPSRPLWLPVLAEITGCCNRKSDKNVKVVQIVESVGTVKVVQIVEDVQLNTLRCHCREFNRIN